MASLVGSFRCHFSAVKASNTGATTPPLLPLRLRLQNPNKDSSFTSSDAQYWKLKTTCRFERAPPQLAMTMASLVGSFRCHFSAVKASNTGATTPPLLPLRLRLQNPNKDSSFTSSDGQYWKLKTTCRFERAPPQLAMTMASLVGSFRCHFSTVKASNTGATTSNKDSSFTSSSSYGHGHGGVAVPIQMVKRLKLQPKPELGLLSLLFVLSAAFGALISLSVVFIPTMKAFRRLASSIDQLSNVVSKEVPGTLISFKLSGLQIQQLTQQLRNLRQKISSSEKKSSSSKH